MAVEEALMSTCEKTLRCSGKDGSTAMYDTDSSAILELVLIVTVVSKPLLLTLEAMILK